MPRHQISTRTLTPEERKQLRSAPMLGSLGCAFVPILIASLIGCGAGAFLQFKIASLNQTSSLPFLAALVAAALVFVPVRAFYRTERAANKSRKEDKDQGVVEAIEVWDPVAVEQLQHNDEGPFYFLDVGAGKILILSGQGLFDVPAFKGGKPWPPGIDEDESVEWAPPFLTTHFVAHRAPRSGVVLRVEVLGEPIQASRTVPIGTVPTDIVESRLFDGTLEDLPESATRALKT